MLPRMDIAPLHSQTHCPQEPWAEWHIEAEQRLLRGSGCPKQRWDLQLQLLGLLWTSLASCILPPPCPAEVAALTPGAARPGLRFWHSWAPLAGSAASDPVSPPLKQGEKCLPPRLCVLSAIMCILCLHLSKRELLVLSLSASDFLFTVSIES